MAAERNRSSFLDRAAAELAYRTITVSARSALRHTDDAETARRITQRAGELLSDLERMAREQRLDDEVLEAIGRQRSQLPH